MSAATSLLPAAVAPVLAMLVTVVMMMVVVAPPSAPAPTRVGGVAVLLLLGVGAHNHLRGVPVALVHGVGVASVSVGGVLGVEAGPERAGGGVAVGERVFPVAGNLNLSVGGQEGGGIAAAGGGFCE